MSLPQRLAMRSGASTPVPAVARSVKEEREPSRGTSPALPAEDVSVTAHIALKLPPRTEKATHSSRSHSPGSAGLLTCFPFDGLALGQPPRLKQLVQPPPSSKWGSLLRSKLGLRDLGPLSHKLSLAS